MGNAGITWCKVGDTIRMTNPFSVPVNEVQYFECILQTPESVAYGNQLIADGTWEVVRTAEIEGMIAGDVDETVDED